MRMNFLNIFVSVFLVSISVTSVAITCDNCTRDTYTLFYYSSHTSVLCFSDIHFATHSLRILFIYLSHSSLNISKNNNRDSRYRHFPCTYSFPHLAKRLTEKISIITFT